MRRIDYRVGWCERRLGVAIAIEFPRALRVPLLALGCSLALSAILATVEDRRLRGLDAAAAVTAAQIDALADDVARVRALERDVARLNARAARIAALRRGGIAGARAIATIGDRLPPDVWLTSLRAERTSLALEGRGERPRSVGEALRVLAALRPYAAARLLAIHADPATSGVTYAIALDRP